MVYFVNRYAEKQDKVSTDIVFQYAKDAGLLFAKILPPQPASSSAESSILAAAIPIDFNTDFNVPKGCAALGAFARANYYREAVSRAKKLVAALRQRYGGSKSDYRIYCNSFAKKGENLLDEKKTAAAARLGVIGRNSLLIAPSLGSRFVIVLVNIPFALTQLAPLKKTFLPCAGCSDDCPPCKAACPTGAVQKDGGIERSLCIQWYASGNGGEVPDVVKQNWGRRLYGCDECQKYCPHNQTPLPFAAAIRRGTLPYFISCNDIINKSDSEIKIFFKGTALDLNRITPELLRRNAMLSLLRC